METFRYRESGVQLGETYKLEGAMKTLVLAVAVFLAVPTLRAQQAEAEKSAPQATPQETTVNSNGQSSLPEAIRPGHPLDPADVDILTGKRDREIEASRRANSVVMGGYGTYSGAYGMNTRRSGALLDLPLLPLRRIGRPFFFFNMAPGGLGSRGFGRR
jgi:hypothetical protein